jgi:hypothetical protein
MSSRGAAIREGLLQKNLRNSADYQDMVNRRNQTNKHRLESMLEEERESLRQIRIAGSANQRRGTALQLHVVNDAALDAIERDRLLLADGHRDL